jgi:hypothetical protein
MNTSIKVFEYCKNKSIQQINDRYRTLSQNSKQEIYNLEYCNCLEMEYTKCLKRLKESDGINISNCQPIVDEYAVQVK